MTFRRLCNWIVPTGAAQDHHHDHVAAAAAATTAVGGGELQHLLHTNNNNNNTRPTTAPRRHLFGSESLNQDDEESDKAVPVSSLFHMDNLAIPISYFVFGLMQGLCKTFLNVYPLDCNATEAQQTTLATITSLPCVLKILYGFMSDNVPICGYRRKPYIFLGWFLAFIMAAILLISSDLTLTITTSTTSTATTTTTNQPPQHEQQNSQKQPPSMEFLSIVFFVLGIGIWLADTTCDAVVAEKTHQEGEKQQRTTGTIQSTCYVARYAGILLASTASTYLYNDAGDNGNGTGIGTGTGTGPQAVVWCIAIIPWILFPFLYFFKEDQNVPIHSIQHHCNEIWNTICSQSVWEPMAFIYIFNLLQVPNPAWRQFLVTSYHFSSTELNLLVVTTNALLLIGMIIYKYCFLQTSWRRIFCLCMLINAIGSSLKLVMIRYEIPMHWNPFWFALGDDALMDLMIGIQKLPITILMMSLCPVGSEGVSYAMLTTLDNSARMLSQALSTSLLGLWDTSKQVMEAGNVNGIFNLSILTTILQLSPIVIVGWMPCNRNELFALQDKPWSGSPLGGTIILVVLVASMVWTVIISLLNIVSPGWNEEF